MITCLPSAPFFSAVFTHFFSFTKTDEVAWPLLLDGGAVAVGRVEHWVERVLGMVVDKESLLIDKQSMMWAHHCYDFSLFLQIYITPIGSVDQEIQYL